MSLFYLDISLCVALLTSLFGVYYRLRDERTDDRQPSIEAKVREISSRNGKSLRELNVESY